MGNVTHFEEGRHDMRRVNYVDYFMRDLRQAGRNLRRSPGFAALAIPIMALGIGANTGVFSAVNAVLLKPLAYRDAERIVALELVDREGATALSKQVSIPMRWIGGSRVHRLIRWHTTTVRARGR